MIAARSDALVFFGATGDLAYKQIFPALQALMKRGHLDVPIIGVAKSGWTLEQLRAHAHASLVQHGGVDETAFTQLLGMLQYVDGDYRDAATYTALRQKLGSSTRPAHYLAIPPNMFATVTEGLAKAGAAKNARVIVEKPFGRNLTSAQDLNHTLHKYFVEQTIFRIDHYLAKEAVQNILYTRFANSIFEPIWNRNYIASVQITMAENFGVEGRGAFYEEAGAIRDVVQNHMLQVIAHLTMDPPTGESNEAVRDEKARLLKAIRTLNGSSVVRGQFRGYHREAGVNPDSHVETFAAVRFDIDTWRWMDVPFFVRTGKCLPVTTTEVLVEFHRPPRNVFHEPMPRRSNYLRFRLSPDVVMAMGVRAKVPGEDMVGQEVELIAFDQGSDMMMPYERLLDEAMQGDPTLFAREDEVEAQWRIVDDILGTATPLYSYDPDTWGPPEAEQIAETDGGWYNPTLTENRS